MKKTALWIPTEDALKPEYIQNILNTGDYIGESFLMEKSKNERKIFNRKKPRHNQSKGKKKIKNDSDVNWELSICKLGSIFNMKANDAPNTRSKGLSINYVTLKGERGSGQVFLLFKLLKF